MSTIFLYMCSTLEPKQIPCMCKTLGNKAPSDSGIATYLSRFQVDNVDHNEQISLSYCYCVIVILNVLLMNVAKFTPAPQKEGNLLPAYSPFSLNMLDTEKNAGYNTGTLLPTL